MSGVVPLSTSAISSIETIQSQVGKSVQCVPQSAANPPVNIELVWKPVPLLVDEAVLRFYHFVTDPSFWGSGLVKSCMAWALSSPTGPYLANLLRLMTYLS